MTQELPAYIQKIRRGRGLYARVLPAVMEAYEQAYLQSKDPVRAKNRTPDEHGYTPSACRAAAAMVKSSGTRGSYPDFYGGQMHTHFGPGWSRPRRAAHAAFLKALECGLSPTGAVRIITVARAEVRRRHGVHLLGVPIDAPETDIRRARARIAQKYQEWLATHIPDGSPEPWWVGKLRTRLDALQKSWLLA